MSDTIDTGDLAELERFVGGMLQSLEPSERRSLFRKVATTMRRRNQQRIAAQRNPDGGRFAARKPPRESVPGNYAVKFLYPSGGSGAPRLVLMKSWTRQGPLMTGYDIEAGGIRSFDYDRIIKFLRVDLRDENRGGGKLRGKPTVRQRAMFTRMRRTGILNAGQNAHEAWAGFAGRVADVARIHQYGMLDRPSPRSPQVRYARRELLGLTASDREELLDAVINHLAPD